MSNHRVFYKMLVLCVLLTWIFVSCAKEKPVNYSSVRAVIDGKECHMFSGYNCEPLNRSFVGQEYQDNVLLRFESLNMAENYRTNNSKDNDTVYVISISALMGKDSFEPNTEINFVGGNITADSLTVLFKEGSRVEEPIIAGLLLVKATHKEVTVNHGIVNPNEWLYAITSASVCFGDMDIIPHLLYGGDRMVWKCKEAFFEFEAESEAGRVIHVTNGYCRL